MGRNMGELNTIDKELDTLDKIFIIAFHEGYSKELDTMRVVITGIIKMK